MYKRTIAAIITFAFLLTQCGLGLAAEKNGDCPNPNCRGGVTPPLLSLKELPPFLSQFPKNLRENQPAEGGSATGEPSRLAKAIGDELLSFGNSAGNNPYVQQVARVAGDARGLIATPAAGLAAGAQGAGEPVTAQAAASAAAGGKLPEGLKDEIKVVLKEVLTVPLHRYGDLINVPYLASRVNLEGTAEEVHAALSALYEKLYEHRESCRDGSGRLPRDFKSEEFDRIVFGGLAIVSSKVWKIIKEKHALKWQDSIHDVISELVKEKNGRPVEERSFKAEKHVRWVEEELEVEYGIRRWVVEDPVQAEQGFIIFVDIVEEDGVVYLSHHRGVSVTIIGSSIKLEIVRDVEGRIQNITSNRRPSQRIDFQVEANPENLRVSLKEAISAYLQIAIDDCIDMGSRVPVFLPGSKQAVQVVVKGEVEQPSAATEAAESTESAAIGAQGTGKTTPPVTAQAAATKSAGAAIIGVGNIITPEKLPQLKEWLTEGKTVYIARKNTPSSLYRLSWLYLFGKPSRQRAYYYIEANDELTSLEVTDLIQNWVYYDPMTADAAAIGARGTGAQVDANMAGNTIAHEVEQAVSVLLGNERIQTLKPLFKVISNDRNTARIVINQPEGRDVLTFIVSLAVTPLKTIKVDVEFNGEPITGGSRTLNGEGRQEVSGLPNELADNVLKHTFVQGKLLEWSRLAAAVPAPATGAAGGVAANVAGEKLLIKGEVARPPITTDDQVTETVGELKLEAAQRGQHLTPEAVAAIPDVGRVVTAEQLLQAKDAQRQSPTGLAARNVVVPAGPRGGVNTLGVLVNADEVVSGPTVTPEILTKNLLVITDSDMFANQASQIRGVTIVKISGDGNITDIRIVNKAIEYYTPNPEDVYTYVNDASRGMLKGLQGIELRDLPKDMGEAIEYLTSL